jgi:hypothetical protein
MCHYQVNKKNSKCHMTLIVIKYEVSNSFAKGSFIIIREKYILAPQTTTISSDGSPNYQCLDSGPPNYHFLIFWPHPSIYAVNFKQNSENTPPTL